MNPAERVPRRRLGLGGTNDIGDDEASPNYRRITGPANLGGPACIGVYPFLASWIKYEHRI